MSSDHTMPKVDVHVIGGRADFDAVASMTTAGSTSRSMSNSSSDTSLLASAASPSVANPVCMNLLVAAKEKQALAKAKLRAAADTEQLVADLEQTIRIHANAKKTRQEHQKCVEKPPCNGRFVGRTPRNVR